MKQTDPQYKLRLPEPLKVAIEEASTQWNRSMNAEIVARLTASFELPPGVETLIDRLGEQQQRIDDLTKQVGAYSYFLELAMLIPVGLGSRILSVLNQIPTQQRAQLAGAEELGTLAEAAVHDDAQTFMAKWTKFNAFGGQQELFAGQAPGATSLDLDASANAAEPAKRERKVIDATAMEHRPLTAARDLVLRRKLSPPEQPFESQVGKIIRRKPEKESPLLSQGPGPRRKKGG